MENQGYHQEHIYAEIAAIDPADYVNVSKTTFEQVKEKSQEDKSPELLKETVQKGWPQEKAQVQPEVREYWPCRDEIAVQD